LTCRDILIIQMMKAINKVIKGYPEPYDIAEAGHFVQE
jgi:hypothetical protein